uniref:Uncharacterized protein n=1 Tax=Cacopsylla melanoneura TaxID=428564 RepID=A0A8D8QZT2_9HEMI
MSPVFFFFFKQLCRLFLFVTFFFFFFLQKTIIPPETQVFFRFCLFVCLFFFSLLILLLYCMCSCVISNPGLICVPVSAQTQVSYVFQCHLKPRVHNVTTMSFSNCLKSLYWFPQLFYSAVMRLKSPFSCLLKIRFFIVRYLTLH